MPDHVSYVEPFAGGLSVLLNKPEAILEVASDANYELVNFWQSMRDHHDQFYELASQIPYTERSFRESMKVGNLMSPSTIGFWFMVRNRFSRGGLGKDFAWSDRIRGGKPGDENAWDTIREEFPAIGMRISGVEFHCSCAYSMIERHEHPKTLFYLDPPYLHETRTCRDLYGQFEMDEDDHWRLLDRVMGSSGMFLISGYRSTLYDRFLRDWNRHDFDLPNHSGQGRTKQRRTECVWCNF